MILPPESLTAKELFELLCERRPSWPFTWLGQSLRARAMTPLEWVHVKRDRNALLLYSVMSGESQVFKRLDDVGELHDDDAMSLDAAASQALAIVAPTYDRVDWMKWNERLIQGADQGGALQAGLGICVDFAFGFGVGRVIERPDRYWGCPVSDLADGHWMAYRAAREVYERNRPK